jgi:hypothetical protein
MQVTGQGGIIIGLLTLLVAIGVKEEFVDVAPPIDPAATLFSVTSVGAGQYVMRAREKIFFCKGNQCTVIKLINVPGQAAAPRPTPPEAPAPSP